MEDNGDMGENGNVTSKTMIDMEYHSDTGQWRHGAIDNGIYGEQW